MCKTRVRGFNSDYLHGSVDWKANDLHDTVTDYKSVYVAARFTAITSHDDLPPLTLKCMD